MTEITMLLFGVSILLLCSSCSHQQESSDLVAASLDEVENVPFLVRQEICQPEDCTQPPMSIVAGWQGCIIPIPKEDELEILNLTEHDCVWKRLSFFNPESTLQVRILYFPFYWRTYQTFVFDRGEYITHRLIGPASDQQVIFLSLPPGDTIEVFCFFPSTSNALFPNSLQAKYLNETQYHRLKRRASIKYLLLGSLLFPLVFFLIQFLMHRSWLNLYYVIFLLGASSHLLDILESDPFFLITPKLLPSTRSAQQLFLISAAMTLGGLAKYIHHFLAEAMPSKGWVGVGNALIAAMILIIPFPFLFPYWLSAHAYNDYLGWFRIIVLLLFLYILALIIWAAIRRIAYSGLLVLAISPLVISGVIYTSAFIVADGGYSSDSWETLILIGGFILCLFLFGIILGVRNNATRVAKVKLEQQTAQLRELDTFKSRFYTNITHEFRTPLTVIRGMANQIQDSKVKSMIHRNSDRLLAMVNHLLDLAKLESKTLKINWVQGDIIPYLRYLTESHYSLSNQKHIQLSFITEVEHLVMDFDEEKLQHILVNLLSNAIKFTPEHGHVRVFAIKEASNLLLKVSDSGRGIPTDKLSHIFDRFYQVDASDARLEEGTGIGLALVKEVVELLAGRVEVESEEGKGSVFSVYLPIHTDATDKVEDHRIRNTEGEAVEHEEEPIPVEADRPLVLVVEDNADVRTYISTCLKGSYRILMATNGKQGVDIAIEQVPDVIISDVMMPEMDGFELCDILKKDRHTSHIPTILLTAKAAREDKMQGLSAGADAYLKKPFDKEELLVRLTNLSAQSRRLQEWLKAPVEAQEAVSPAQTKEATFLKNLQKVVSSKMEDEAFNTEALCQEMGMSRTQLFRKIKALTGLATAHYIRSIRLAKAKELIQQTDQTISEIAYQVGFKDVAHFSRSFSKAYGAPPSKARN